MSKRERSIAFIQSAKALTGKLEATRRGKKVPFVSCESGGGQFSPVRICGRPTYRGRDARGERRFTGGAVIWAECSPPDPDLRFFFPDGNPCRQFRQRRVYVRAGQNVQPVIEDLFVKTARAYQTGIRHAQDAKRLDVKSTRVRERLAAPDRERWERSVEVLETKHGLPSEYSKMTPEQMRLWRRWLRSKRV